MIDQAIFERLQAKIDEDVQVKEDLRNILQNLERQGRTTLSVLARAHSTPFSELPAITAPAERAIAEETATIAHLARVASSHPYYRYNALWTRDVQNSCFAVVLCGWLGGWRPDGGCGRLLSIEEVGAIMGVPVNLKDTDAFHLTIEEYLHALISLIEELARLAVNSVTLGDYQAPLQISRFIKDLHGGFQILNLKNDSLRKRSDGIKYNVKKVEDVVYDLSLRNLVARDGVDL